MFLDTLHDNTSNKNVKCIDSDRFIRLDCVINPDPEILKFLIF